MVIAVGRVIVGVVAVSVVVDVFAAAILIFDLVSLSSPSSIRLIIVVMLLLLSCVLSRCAADPASPATTASISTNIFLII